MKRKCRSCKMMKDMGADQLKHELVAPPYKCVICNKQTKWYSHLCDDLMGDSLECKSCHNFIIYALPDIDPKTEEHYYNIWKDEIYLSQFSKEILVLRSYEDNTTFISINDIKVTALNHIIQFESLIQLYKKLESIVVFS